MRAARAPIDPAWVEWVFETVSLLVEEGDGAGLAATVAELSRSRSALPEGAEDAPVRPAS